LNGEQKEQEPPPEPPKEEKQPVAAPEEGNPKTGVSEISGLEASSEEEQPPIEDNESSKPKDILGVQDPPIEPQEPPEGLPADVPETADAMDINNPKIAEQLSTAEVLRFCGMKDSKFLFECTQFEYQPVPKTCFSADNIEDVWRESKNVISLCFFGEFPEDFQIPGDRLKKLKNVIFLATEIENFEAAKHLTGTFEGLLRIEFRECINLQSARISGEFVAPNFCHVLFTDCPILDDVHIGDHQIDEQIIKNVHLHKFEECLFGKTGEFCVEIYDCQKFSERQTNFDCIVMHGNWVRGCSKTRLGNKTTHSLVRRTFGQESSLSNANNTSTLNLQLPGITSSYVVFGNAIFGREILNSHVIVNFTLAESRRVLFQIDKPKIKHLEFIRPMDNCRVKFHADPDGTLLEINGFPQNSTGDTGKPFKMSFSSLEDSKLPGIKLNGTILENIKWYQYQLNDEYVWDITPVISENLKKIQGKPGWVPIQWENMNLKNVELNSEFLFAQEAD
jgi:hypothetical protein